MPTYHLTPILAPSGNSLYINDLNENGDFAGYYLDEDFNSVPYVSRNGVLTALATQGPNGGTAYALNDAGQIVGSVSRPDDLSGQAALWSATGSLTVISNFGSGDGAGIAYDINNNGVVVGNGQQILGGASSAYVRTADGSVTNYGTFDASKPEVQATFNAVNDAGQIVGTTNVFYEPSRAIRATVGTPGLAVVSPDDGQDWVPNEIDASGVAAATGGGGAALLFPDGSYQILDLRNLNLTDTALTSAVGLNDTGLVVGRLFGTDADGNFAPTGFLYAGGVAYAMTDIVDNLDGWAFLSAANDVNNDGTIVGFGNYNGTLTAFLATPVPKPAGLALAATCVAALLRRRR